MPSLEHYIHILESIKDQAFAPLVPIASKISLGQQRSNQVQQKYFYPKTLSYDALFPDSCDTQGFDEQVLNLFTRYDEELNKIDSLDRQAYADTLFYLVAKYCSRVGVSGIEGISGFDYIRVKAATSYASETNTLYPYRLIKGDISGIQNFIYHTSDATSGQPAEGKNKAKRLRGRSFYITLLTETIADYFIYELGLQEANILYCGGGHFTILAPNEPEIENKIYELQIRINRFFFESFQLRLVLVIASIEAPSDIVDNFAITSNLLENKINQAKKQKAVSSLELFGQTIDWRTSSDLSLDDSFRMIGEALTKDCILLQVYDDSNIEIMSDQGISICFKGLGISWVLIKDYSVVDKLRDSMKIKRVRIFFINEPEDFLNLSDKFIQAGISDVSYGFKFFGVYVPFNISDGKKEIYDFETLSKKNGKDGSLEYPLLSVMRLDLDNLGAIFAFGLENSGKTSLYDVVALSRELIHFFCYYFNKLAEKYSCYITYSGGDDAFVAGSWINILRFALQLNIDFKAFCCNNLYLTLSSGILQCASYYPVQKAGSDAGELEAEAKNYNFYQNISDKDAVNIFETVVKWETLNAQVLLAEEFQELFEPIESERNFSRSLLHHILLQLKEVVRENGDFDLSKLHNLSMRLTWLFAKKPHGITADKICDYNKGKLERIERLKVKLAKRLMEEKTSDMVLHYQIITNYILLITRKSKN
jgi:CRISPR-associated protein Csm1